MENFHLNQSEVLNTMEMPFTYRYTALKVRFIQYFPTAQNMWTEIL